MSDAEIRPVRKVRAFAPVTIDAESAPWFADAIAAHVIGTQHAPPGSLEKFIAERIIAGVHKQARLVQFLKANEYRQ